MAAPLGQPIMPNEKHRDAVARVHKALAAVGADRVVLIVADGQQIPLTTELRRLLLDAATQLEQDHGIVLVATGRELTTQQAAEVLNVSRPFLIQLLEKGAIPFRRVGTHRRIELAELLKVKTERGRGRRAALDALADQAQDLGIYDD